MHWILQNNIFNEAAFDTLVATLERFNIPYSIHKVIPFIGELEPSANPNPECEVNVFSSRACERTRHHPPGSRRSSGQLNQLTSRII